MAEVHGKNLNAKLNSLSTDTYTKSVTLNVDNDVVEATAAGDTAKTHLEGTYSWTYDGEYNWEGSSGQIDHTIYNFLSSGSLAVQVLPKGGGASSTNSPLYRGDAILKSFSISIPHDGIVTETASFQGDGVLNRYTSGTY